MQPEQFEDFLVFYGLAGGIAAIINVVVHTIVAIVT
jgi:hypothetical protein